MIFCRPISLCKAKSIFGPNNRFDPFAYGLLALAILFAYANIYHNQFLMDDDALILKNQYLGGWGHLGDLFASSIARGAHMGSDFYRPLQMLLYLFVYHLAGPEPWAFHLLNLVLHILNASLVYRIGRKLGFNRGGVLFASLIWAIHPIQTEAVTYMSATSDVLYGFFCLSGIAVLLPSFSRRGIGCACGFFLLALLSKETALAFPLLAASCLYLTTPDRLKIASYLRLWPLGLIAVLYVSLRLVFAHAVGIEGEIRHDFYAEHLSARIYTALATLPSYVGLILWPGTLHHLRDFPIYTDPMHPPIWGGGALLAAAFGQIAYGRGQRGLALSWGLLWFLSANALHAGILIPINGIFMEHWMYLASAGLSLGVSETLTQHLNLKTAKFAAATAVVFAVFLGCKTYAQNKTWENAETFYRHIFVAGDYLPKAHTGLGSFYFQQKDYGRALEQFDQAIARSQDSLAEPQYNEGVIWMQKNGGDENLNVAAEHFKRALQINPDLFPASQLLAVIYSQLGDSAQADFYRQQTESIYEKVRATYGGVSQ